jgi:hypothetical protein
VQQGQQNWPLTSCSLVLKAKETSGNLFKIDTSHFCLPISPQMHF